MNTDTIVTTAVICIIIAGAIGVGYAGYLAEKQCQGVERIEIESISINSEVEGSFALGSGSIDTEQYYVFYTETGQYDALELQKIRARQTRIHEFDGVHPHIERPVCIRADETYDLYVPEGTVMLDYNIEQPGLKNGGPR